jgi:hypothetical protein
MTKKMESIEKVGEKVTGKKVMSLRTFAHHTKR